MGVLACGRPLPALAPASATRGSLAHSGKCGRRVVLASLQTKDLFPSSPKPLAVRSSPTSVLMVPTQSSHQHMPLLSRVDSSHGQVPSPSSARLGQRPQVTTETPLTMLRASESTDLHSCCLMLGKWGHRRTQNPHLLPHNSQRLSAWCHPNYLLSDPPCPQHPMPFCSHCDWHKLEFLQAALQKRDPHIPALPPLKSPKPPPPGPSWAFLGVMPTSLF